MLISVRDAGKGKKPQPKVLASQNAVVRMGTSAIEQILVVTEPSG